jgi:NO-binding membrane sensor protein with MHYT domain
MSVTHERWLVALSVIVVIQGAYVGLSLAVQVAESAGLRRRLLLAGAALSLAVAIWSMHFVGMLAARVPFPVDHLVFPTLLSFVVCVLVVGAAVFAVSAGPPDGVRLAAAAIAMGGGIASMHYIGMTALHASAHMQHAPALVGASIVVAIAASGLALWLAGGRGGRPPLFLSAIALGVAISGMHYTAMAGLTLQAAGHSQISAPALSSDLLAIVVAIVSFLVSGIFLLTLVPDRSGSQNERVCGEDTGARGPAADVANAGSTILNAAEFGHGSFGPLGGAGRPPRRFARHLPVEREGVTQYVGVDTVVAVHANAHYTYVFDGTTKLFCPFPISDVEARLDTRRFLRVHRSHIVNIERVLRIKRAGDSGVVELDVADPLSGACEPQPGRPAEVTDQFQIERAGTVNASASLTLFVKKRRDSCAVQPLRARLVVVAAHTSPHWIRSKLDNLGSPRRGAGPARHRED